MATKEEVTKLASLARISLPDQQADAFLKEFDAILEYVNSLESLTLPGGSTPHVGTLHNVFRADEEAHPAGKYTRVLVKAFPEKQGNHLKVKQIITHD